MSDGLPRARQNLKSRVLERDEQVAIGRLYIGTPAKILGRYEVAGVRFQARKEPSGEITFIFSVLNP